MAVWKWATWFGVSGLGALTFLNEVAQEKERTDRLLARRKDAADKAAKRAAEGTGVMAAFAEGDAGGGYGPGTGFISRQSG